MEDRKDEIKNIKGPIPPGFCFDETPMNSICSENRPLMENTMSNLILQRETQKK
jgi:hypothetical protein